MLWISAELSATSSMSHGSTVLFKLNRPSAMSSWPYGKRLIFVLKQ
jgi:hypothetical protein